MPTETISTCGGPGPACPDPGAGTMSRCPWHGHAGFGTVPPGSVTTSVWITQMTMSVVSEMTWPMGHWVPDLLQSLCGRGSPSPASLLGSKSPFVGTSLSGHCLGCFECFWSDSSCPHLRRLVSLSPHLHPRQHILDVFLAIPYHAGSFRSPVFPHTTVCYISQPPLLCAYMDASPFPSSALPCSAQLYFVLPSSPLLFLLPSRLFLSPPLHSAALLCSALPCSTLLSSHSPPLLCPPLTPLPSSPLPSSPLPCSILLSSVLLAPLHFVASFYPFL